jgi:hypothetical protein
VILFISTRFLSQRHNLNLSEIDIIYIGGTMSERMIELHRARLLAAGKGSKNNTETSGVASLHPQQNGALSTAIPYPPNPPQTPQQYAVSTVQMEDSLMKHFFQRLHHERDDSQPCEAFTGPTVPTALSRRMLHRQGAGYYDGTVAAIASAAADRFLATVLQQAVACRDQRLKGAEIARQSARSRKRHRRQYQESTDDRRRRKDERAALREEINLAAIAAADALKQKTSSASSNAADLNADDGGAAAGSPTKSKKKKKANDAAPLNGLKKRASDLSEDESSYDSIDEEEEYYAQFYSDDEGNDSSENDDDEDDEMMILRDLSRPLEAWDLHLNGKLDMNWDTLHDEHGKVDDDQSSEEDDFDDDRMDESNNEGIADDTLENGVNNDTAAKPATAKKSPSKSPDEKKASQARKSSDSPSPGNAP